MVMLPSAYEEYIAEFIMDAEQKAQLLFDYKKGISDSVLNLMKGTGTWEEATRL
jgi:hypothetical protein